MGWLLSKHESFERDFVGGEQWLLRNVVLKEATQRGVLWVKQSLRVSMKTRHNACQASTQNAYF